MTAQPMFPLESALLPGEVLPLRIFEPRYAQLVEDCLALPDPAFGVVLITRGREVGGGDSRGDVGALAHIAEHVDLGMGLHQLNALVGERIRINEWLPDDPYPRAVIEPWPDDPGPPVTDERIGEVIDGILALLELIVNSRGTQLRPDALAVEPEIADDPARHIYALASRVPMGQADRYALLAAPTLAERVDVLTDAIETVTAMVEFQIADED
ncbi:LON peptidase substrate-binding domain-containing protein [Mycolicibacterium sp. CBM1]